MGFKFWSSWGVRIKEFKNTLWVSHKFSTDFGHYYDDFPSYKYTDFECFNDLLKKTTSMLGWLQCFRYSNREFGGDIEEIIALAI